MNPILARLAVSLPGIPIVDSVDAPVPREIQWMPPGTHEIAASQGDKTITRKIKVDAAAVAKLQQLLQTFRGKAAEGTEDLPYLDFNHDDAEASARVLEFKWGGDDPVKGGIRAVVEWTGPGRQALQGKAYRRFSPSFFVDAEGRVTGAPVNMGGLVNRAAFKTIQPIVAGATGDANERNPNMDADKMAADLAAANSKIVELQAKLEAAIKPETVQAKDTEITALKAKLADQAKARAEGIVAKAVEDGKLPPQNKEIQAKWVKALIETPELEETLIAIQAKSVTGQIIVNGRPEAQTATSGSEAEQFVAEVKAKHTELKDKSKALDAAISAKPKLYEAWRKANGQPGLSF
jgi:phage I-like protein